MKAAHITSILHSYWSANDYNEWIFLKLSFIVFSAFLFFIQFYFGILILNLLCFLLCIPYKSWPTFLFLTFLCFFVLSIFWKQDTVEDYFLGWVRLLKQKFNTFNTLNTFNVNCFSGICLLESCFLFPSCLVGFFISCCMNHVCLL